MQPGRKSESLPDTKINYVIRIFILFVYCIAERHQEYFISLYQAAIDKIFLQKFNIIFTRDYDLENGIVHMLKMLCRCSIIVHSELLSCVWKLQTDVYLLESFAYKCRDDFYSTCLHLKCITVINELF